MLDAVLLSVELLGLVLLVHHHVLYPVALTRIAERRRRSGAANEPSTLAGHDDDPPPRITVIVPVHNEEKVIARKIRNLVAIDYPRNRLELVVALDGCRDDTRRIALETAQACARDVALEIVEYEKNVGKVAVLNAQIERAKGDVVALSDTSALIPPDALRRAAVHFRDPAAGFVAPKYVLETAGSPGELAYMQYLARIRRDEATVASPLGAHGALYLFRRKLWQPLPRDTINDDFVLPMQIVAKGYKGIYDEDIVVLELEQTQRLQEFRRRVRIGAGNLQQSLRLMELADPRRPWLAAMFVSGKGARPFMPLVALCVLVATAWLALRGVPWHRWLLALEIAAIAAGSVVIANRSVAWPRPLVWLGYLLEGYAASSIGAIQYAMGRRIARWQSSEAVAAPSTVGRWYTSDEVRQGGPLDVDGHLKAPTHACRGA